MPRACLILPLTLLNSLPMNYIRVNDTGGVRLSPVLVTVVSLPENLFLQERPTHVPLRRQVSFQLPEPIAKAGDKKE